MAMQNLKVICVSTMLYATISKTAAVTSFPNTIDESTLNWSKNGILYQIYSHLFMDCDDDDVSNIRGIIVRASTHLVILGIDKGNFRYILFS